MSKVHSSHLSDPTTTYFPKLTSRALRSIIESHLKVPFDFLDRPKNAHNDHTSQLWLPRQSPKRCNRSVRLEFGVDRISPDGTIQRER